mgnify:CR=1 FL=1
MAKSKYSLLLEKSIQAVLSAIELYNKPVFSYREESFSILMVNAWELLLKAKKLKDNNGKLTCLYIPISKKTKSEKPRQRFKYKTTKSGNYMTVGITDLIEQEIIDARAEEIGEIIAKTTQESLEAEIGKTFEVYVDGESEEHEYLLSARKTLWAPDIDGEIYINDNELKDGEQIKFGQIYTVKVTELVGDKLLATVIK